MTFTLKKLIYYYLSREVTILKEFPDDYFEFKNELKEIMNKYLRCEESKNPVIFLLNACIYSEKKVLNLLGNDFYNKACTFMK